jgi:hypothetical protein
VRAVIAVLMFTAARSVAPRPVAWAAALACLLWTSFCGFYGYPLFPALALVLVVLLLLARTLERRYAGESLPRLAMPAAGAILGAAALLRHDLAGYGFAASVPFLIALSGVDGREKPEPAGRRVPEGLRVWGGFLAGSAAAFGIPMALVLAAAPLRQVVWELFTHPFTTYPKVRGLPGVFLEWLSYLPAYTPLAIFAAGAAWSLAHLRARGRNAAEDVRTLRVLALVILGVFSFNLARVRADMIHGMGMLLISYAVAAALVASAWASRRPWRIPAAAAIAVVGWVSISTPLYQLSTYVRGRAPVTPCRSCGADREAAGAYLNSVVPPGGRIYVGCGRHDIVFANEPILYHLAHRLPGVKYHVLDPGVATTLEAQREMVAGLERHGVQWLVLSIAFDEFREPNLSSVSSGVTVLDDYIRAHYRVDRTFGPNLTVWKRAAGS